MNNSVVDESSIIASLAADESSSPQPLKFNVRQPAMDVITETSTSQQHDPGVVGEDQPLASEQQDNDNACLSHTLAFTQPQQPGTSTSGGSSMSTVVILGNHIANATDTETVGSDKPSSVIVVRSHRHDKEEEASGSCLVDLNYASAEVNACDSRLLSDEESLPRSAADLYMSCSDDNAASSGDLPSENADSVHAQSERELKTSSDDASAELHVVIQKQCTTANGRDIQHDFIFVLIYIVYRAQYIHTPSAMKRPFLTTNPTVAITLTLATLAVAWYWMCGKSKEP